MLKARANLLLITFDQWRGDWADPSNKILSLSTLERLAAQSLVFRSCYTSSPQCVPARLSWLTGLAPSQMGVTRNCAAEATEDSPSIFRELKQKGWHTQLIGKTHWTNHREEVDLRDSVDLIKSLGFNKVTEVAGPRALRHVKCELTDDWENYGLMDMYKKDMLERYGTSKVENAWAVRPSILPNHLYPDNWIANRAIQALEGMPPGKPWLLWISFVGPHEPFDTPKQFGESRFGNLPRPIPRGRWIEELQSNCELKKSANKWGKKLTTEAIRAFRTDYANHLQLLDNQLKRLIETLERRTDSKSTAIAITSDHGEMLGDHGMLYKGTFLESSVRVPFQYRPPPNERFNGKVINKPVELTSLLKIILEQTNKRCSTKKIEGIVERTNHVCVEYGEEILIIKGRKKLCCTLTGEVLWSTNLKKDPEEQSNKAIEVRANSGKDKKWNEVVDIANYEISRRNKGDWLWRDLKKEKIN